jgi:hyperosmotically inducible periplasmic protein
MTHQSDSLPIARIAAAIGGADAANASQVSLNLADARRETQIWTTFALNPCLRAYPLEASVSDGFVVLTGKVADEGNKELAQLIALKVDGVHSVDNRIEVDGQFVPPVNSRDRAFGELIDDTTVTSAVRSKLAWSHFADGLQANVASSKGGVKLSGTAQSDDVKAAAGKLALSTHGVSSVDNQIEVRADDSGVVTSIGSTIADGWITTKVRSMFLYSTHVAGRAIAVSTRGGIVSLSGRVANETERALAVELAGNVRGVKTVESGSLTM